MDVNTILSAYRNCECGKEHGCDIKSVVIEKNAVAKIPEIAKDYKGILLVADRNTYRVCGKDVEALSIHKDIFIFEEEGLVIPNEKAWEAIQNKVTDEIDLIIGVGSGVIQDLCKYVSFLCKIDYFIVATAPSMDGYASVGAAMIANDMKVTFSAHVPKAIIADTEVLKDAPLEMIVAGYGDIIGKYSCLNDWKLAHLVTGEYLCDFVLNATYETVEKTVRLADGLVQRNADAIKALTEALVAVGILMAYVGNSRPASGSEHHLSHYFEIVGIVRGEKYFAHGIDVCFSAIETAKIREKLVGLTNLSDFAYSFDKEAYEREIRRIYGKIANEVLALQEKLGWYKTDRVKIYREKWQEIRALLRSAPTAAEMLSLTEKVGLSYETFKKEYGEEKIEDALFYAKDLKDRYSVLWLYYDLFGFRA